MTTPERLRRRQRIEGTILILLGILMIIQAAYFQHQNDLQKRCVQQQVQAITKSYTARALLTEQDSEVKTKVIRTIAVAKTPQQVRTALDTFLGAQAKIDQERRNHPVPPFPPGRCTQ